ncbi:unnamed protein product [Brassica napus]|uniref:(rape) hypothetical protein n=1 Tax=Brassica napus TaxID=3708 RepID=A0A816TB66_BRANA|nr:unnamed protein product [Brassica napus]
MSSTVKLPDDFPHKAKQLTVTDEPVEDISKGHTTRVTSSNYKPFNAWVYGAQMVVFNMQGYRKALWMMQYMKKPDFMMIKGSDREVFDPKAKLPTTLRVKVYMVKGWDSGFQQACFSTWSSPNFYTRVGITGVRGDRVMKNTLGSHFGTRSLSFSLQYQSWRCSKWKFTTTTC